MTMRRIILATAAASVLARMELPEVQVQHLDRKKPVSPDPNKRAKVKAARKQKKDKRP
jgi:hypothetical protein